MTTLTISRPFFPTLATAPPFPNHQQPPNCRISPTPVMTPLVSQPPHCYAWTRHLFNCLDHPVFPIDHHRTKYTIPWFNLRHHRKPPPPHQPSATIPLGKTASTNNITTPINHRHHHRPAISRPHPKITLERERKNLCRPPPSASPRTATASHLRAADRPDLAAAIRPWLAASCQSVPGALSVTSVRIRHRHHRRKPTAKWTILDSLELHVPSFGTILWSISSYLFCVDTFMSRTLTPTKSRRELLCPALLDYMMMLAETDLDVLSTDSVASVGPPILISCSGYRGE
ncbi:leucine-rich repeat extensin-like protein 7 [Iris pallida]|uniref:Leucine-rich repeat extensin-like protein 7 n=1 Tax=Iris pallida TaxID=29817 RepID=A0AAX6DIF4_IRIPA|nr:leucine-rich repeat extensin-like protein 7 [Iris pallida]